MPKKQFIKSSGFTLFELVIVISVIAILIAIALPNYQSSVRKARRVDAQKDLTAFAQVAERIFTEKSSYTTAPLPDNTDYYTYSFPVAVTATTYTIRATPTAVQAADDCGTMSLTNTGQKTHTGTDADCW